MHHLFLGISPASLVHAPYTPAISQPLTLRASDYGIHIHKKGQLILLPNIAGYIGADTSGCLLALRQDLKEETTLLLDVGTNTEMILGNKHGLLPAPQHPGLHLKAQKSSAECEDFQVPLTM